MFMVYCDNQKCHKQTAALIDPDDGLAYCAECDRSITNITPFAKNQLKSFGQVRRKNETYSVLCAKCGKTARPKLQSNSLVCPKCSSPSTNVSKPFEILIRQAIEGESEEI